MLDLERHKSIFMFVALKKKKKKKSTGLPLWLSGEEFACQCRRHGIDPWSEKIPHATEQLSLWATITESVLWSLRAATIEPTCCNYWSLRPGAQAPRQEKPPQCEAWAQPESSPTHCDWRQACKQSRPSTAKNEQICKRYISTRVPFSIWLAANIYIYTHTHTYVYIYYIYIQAVNILIEMSGDRGIGGRCFNNLP